MCEIIQDDRHTPAEAANNATNSHLQCIGTPKADCNVAKRCQALKETPHVGILCAEQQREKPHEGASFVNAL